MKKNLNVRLFIVLIMIMGGIIVIFSSCSDANGSGNRTPGRPGTSKRLMKYVNTGYEYIDNTVDTMYHIGDTVYINVNVKAVVKK